MTDKHLNPRMISTPVTKKMPTVISFLSGKGGVGKSVIAYNLAVALSGQQRSTLMVDADRNFGNQHLLANVILRPQLTDSADDSRSAQKAIIKLNEFLHLLTSFSDHNKSTQPGGENLADFRGRLKSIYKNYDFILIDTPTGDLKIISQAASVADMNLIIITPDITAIADGYGLFKYLLKSKKNISVALLVNRAEDGTDYEYIYQKFAVMTDRFLGKIPQAAGYLLDDKAIAESVRRQKSVFELSSASGSAEQFLNLCDFLTETGLEISVSTPFKREQSINSRAFLADIRE